MSFNFSSLVGPLLGGAMFDIMDYRPTLDCNMVLELLFAIIFIYFNCGKKVFDRDTQLRADLKHLKEKSE